MTQYKSKRARRIIPKYRDKLYSQSAEQPPLSICTTVLQHDEVLLHLLKRNNRNIMDSLSSYSISKEGSLKAVQTIGSC